MCVMSVLSAGSELLRYLYFSGVLQLRFLEGDCARGRLGRAGGVCTFRGGQEEEILGGWDGFLRKEKKAGTCNNKLKALKDDGQHIKVFSEVNQCKIMGKMAKYLHAGWFST